MTEFAELSKRVTMVRDRVSEACRNSGRAADEVSVIPISKKHSPDMVAAMAAQGFSVFGESRVPEAESKIPLCSSSLQWHMIGHLQGNKVTRCVRLFEMIHSVDSEKLLASLNDACCKEGKRVSVLLQLNVSGEASKYGFDPATAEAALELSASFVGLDVVGLMTMAPAVADPEDTRPVFAALREKRDELREKTGFPLDELSMGMSRDYAVAVEEGATLLRLGTALFGKRGDAAV